MFSLAATPPVATPRANTKTPAASGWSIVSSPNSRPTPTHNFPFGVTCLSASDCWAVGYYDNVSAYQTLIERWDGTAWTIVSSPNTGVTQHNLLRDVTCPSASECWAVGSYYDGSFYQTLIERWDGTSWSIVSSPNTSSTQYNYLVSVTCASASECWAVGSYSNGSVQQTLTERWNGSSWTIVTSPNTGGSQENILNAVTCVSVSDCWAVGASINDTTGVYQTLIERWNGMAWAVVTSANTLIPQDNYLSDVACTSSTDCWTVGYSNNGIADQTLIERWDGASWTIASSGNTMITQNNRLSGVTCSWELDCWAVGHSNNGTADQTLIERWNGSSWTIVTSPNTSAAQNNSLSGVTCVSASQCWAVASYFNGSVQQSLIVGWDGLAWSIVTSPNSSAAQNNTLLGITCVSSSDCWGVASYYNGSVQQTLIEHWDGTSWTIVSSPNTSASQNNILYDVTCTSASNCWAVGYYLAASAYQTLIEHWDGTSWTIVSSPSTGATQNNFLSDVTCISASQCWTVGFFDNDSTYQTLIERWDGISWTIVASPNISGVPQNRLYGVTCPSASECWATGRYFTGLVLQTLIERWDGTSWTIISSPNTSVTQDNYLWGVACSSPSDCWTVGSYGSGANGQTLIERWDGASWAIVASPNPIAPNNYNFLRSVTCASASDCWAVGYYFADSAYRTLTERWDGTSWVIVNSPNTNATQYNYLFGVTCVSASDCWALGYYTDDSGIIQTLTEHYAASLPPIPTSVVSRKTHGGSGSFDIELPVTGNAGIECRSGGATNEYQIVLTFATAVTFDTASVTSGAGTVSSSSGNSTTEITLNLTGIANAQTIALTLFSASDGINTGDVSVPMKVLVGDVTSNGVVSNTDVASVKAQVAAPVDSSNFRHDVNANGIISNTDVSATKAQVGTSLP